MTDPIDPALPQRIASGTATAMDAQEVGLTLYELGKLRKEHAAMRAALVRADLPVPHACSVCGTVYTGLSCAGCGKEHQVVGARP